MKVAIVHDWLTGLRGGEKCLSAFLTLYPEADIYTLIHIPGSTTKEIDARVKGVSFLSWIPKIRSIYRYLLPLYPLAIKLLSHRLKEYDLVISLSHAAAKNISLPSSTIHICYCFTPMRYIWDQAGAYFGKKRFLLSPLLKLLQWWDVRGASRVNTFVAISQFVRKRIRDYYGREALVIHPPVRIEDIPLRESIVRDSAPYLCAGALVPYKKIDVAIEAFNDLGLPLEIVGQGPEIDRLKALARENIKFLGYVSDAELFEEFCKAKALVFPGTEDFGLIPVEFMASGGPVIALESGGVTESVIGVGIEQGRATGVFYREGDKESLKAAVLYFEKVRTKFSPETCRLHAERFSESMFEESWKTLIQKYQKASGC